MSKLYFIFLQIVQQLSGKKKRFIHMLRAPMDEWCMPPRPEVRPVKMTGDRLLQHVVGRSILRAPSALNILQELSRGIATSLMSDDTEVPPTTCIHEASKAGNMGFVFLLLQYRPTLVHIIDQDGNTPLHVAAMTGNIAILTLLYEVGAKLNCFNNIGLTPKQLAEQYSSPATVAALATLEEVSNEERTFF